MARITVEDCVTIVPNRFELCLVAINRAKSILSGAATTLNHKEKPVVIALRELAEGLVDPDIIKQNIVRSIKNRGAFEIISSNDQVVQSINEENESGFTLKNHAFVDENIKIDD
jgi:DNA-directed RNA polymerase subunit omega